MACGCCAVASDVGGNPELVTHAETGMLFQPRDQAGLAQTLRLLIGEAALRNKLASRAAQAIHGQFSLDKAARRMGEIYAGVLG